MSNHCQLDPCITGKCAGCVNGQIWCEDPLCSPNCIGCQPLANKTSLTTFSIIIIIIAIIGLLIIIYISWHASKPPILYEYNSKFKTSNLPTTTYIENPEL